MSYPVLGQRSHLQTRARHSATSTGSAASVARQQPVAAARSVSCSRTVAPPRRSRRTAAATDPGVASAVQSRPQADQRTGVSPARAAASQRPPVRMP
ncbi:hypothetical protein M271_47425 [Streptomyces rapamycinicus NRRL 5491]|nr:hypothetical protein M271_47425 [Streptomyces rapamycinicus NRRL 5491]